MGILSRLFPSGRGISGLRINHSARQQGPLVHVFVFDSGEAGMREPRAVSNLVRSLLPECVAYADAPISFFTGKEMLLKIGETARHQEVHLIRYPFAWAKVKETQPALVEVSPEGCQRFSYTLQEYDREGGNKGLVVAFYSVVEGRGIKPRASEGA